MATGNLPLPYLLQLPPHEDQRRWFWIRVALPLVAPVRAAEGLGDEDDGEEHGKTRERD